MGMAPEVQTEIFRTKEFIAFSALSKRVLFQGHFDYTNSDAYSVLVQRFRPGKTHQFSFTTRRRDGGTSQTWSNNSFAFQRPHHVDPNWKVDCDQSLLSALLKLPDKDKNIYEAILEFNSANTDSSEVPVHVEVVMCKSAFEWLLHIDSNRESFIKALKKILPQDEEQTLNGPLADKWRNRWKLKNGVPRLINAWAAEFCVIRGAAAHGSERPKNFVWGELQHLAFASILFPLLTKKTLEDKHLYKMSDVDHEHLRLIERYLLIDPFSPEARDKEGSHAWAEIHSEARYRMISLGLRDFPLLD